MKCAVSNIAWAPAQDEEMYAFLQKNGFSGLEIAPTRLFPEAPYDHLQEAALFARRLKERFGLTIPSMQSIWYGRTERLFGTAAEYESLLAYTKKAVDFAAAIGCPSLVFGCPKNRVLPEGSSDETALRFFGEAGAYAAPEGVALALEANPPLYGTNYLNHTADVFAAAAKCASAGVSVNLDMGAILAQQEALSLTKEEVGLISHVHISEPGLLPVEARPLHTALAQQLCRCGYQNFISLEMGSAAPLARVQQAALYVKEIFG